MLGTNPYPFSRLTEKVVEWAENTGEHIIIQSGSTPVTSDKVESYSFIDHSRIMKLMQEAEVVISQGGFGSLQDCMKAGAKTVAVPRLMELGESQDDQKEIVDALAQDSLIVPLYNIDDLDKAVEDAKKIKLNKTDDNIMPKHISSIINGFLGK